jgi:peroxiredoxin
VVHRLSLLIVVAALAACAGCTGNAPTPTAPAAARALPTTTIVTLDQRTTDLTAAVRGRPALVSLWATWCEACVTELDALNRLDARAKERGAVVVGIAVGEPREKVADFVAAHGLRYAQLVDEDFKFADALGERRVPTTLVVDRTGRVVYVGGALDERALDAFRSAL